MKNILHVLVIICISILNGCEKEPEIQPKDYPLIQTNEVSEINQEGVTMNGRFIQAYNSDIIDIGFLWGEEPTPDQFDYQVSVPDEGIKEDFKIRITSSLKENKVYHVRTYVKTDKYVVYGNTVLFTSEGCLAPELHGFFPQSSRFGGDTVKIWGKNFSYRLNDNKVYFGTVPVKVLSKKGDTLYVVTPLVNETVNVKIFVKIFNGVSVSEQDFSMIYPWQRISDFPGSPRVSPTCFPLAGEIYIVGGKNNDLLMNDNWKYSPQSNMWHQIADFPGIARFDGEGGNSGSNGFVSFGYTIRNYYWESVNDCWEYSAISNGWSRVFQYPEEARYNAYTVVAHNGDYYILYRETGSLWLYSKVSGWIQKTRCPLVFGGDYFELLNVGISINNQLLFFSDKSIWKYDPDLNEWEKINVSTYQITQGFSIKGKIYFMAERGEILVEYNPLSNNFIPRANFPYRLQASFFTDGNDIYYGLGGCDVCDWEVLPTDLYKIAL